MQRICAPTWTSVDFARQNYYRRAFSSNYNNNIGIHGREERVTHRTYSEGRGFIRVMLLAHFLCFENLRVRHERSTRAGDGPSCTAVQVYNRLYTL